MPLAVTSPTPFHDMHLAVTSPAFLMTAAPLMTVAGCCLQPPSHTCSDGPDGGLDTLQRVISHGVAAALICGCCPICALMWGINRGGQQLSSAAAAPSAPSCKVSTAGGSSSPFRLLSHLRPHVRYQPRGAAALHLRLLPHLRPHVDHQALWLPLLCAGGRGHQALRVYVL